MNFLTFLSSIITALAWPATVVYGLFFLVRKLPVIVPFIEVIRIKDFEITMQKAREEFEIIQERTGPIEFQLIEPDDKILKLAEIDSSVAIIEIWKKLEADIIGLIQ